MSTSGPPELPGLIAASVWIASSTDWLELLLLCEPLLSLAGTTGRLSAETMPVVTVLDRPSGEPTATTLLADDDRRGVAEGRRGEAADARWPGSPRGRWPGPVPTIVAGAVLPSSKVTVIVPPDADRGDHVVVGQDLTAGRDDDPTALVT